MKSKNNNLFVVKISQFKKLKSRARCSKERSKCLNFSARAALRNTGGSNGKENAENSGIIGIDGGENFANLQHFNPEHLASNLFLMPSLQRNFNNKSWKAYMCPPFQRRKECIIIHVFRSFLSVIKPRMQCIGA